jgi:hypothetical protein
MSNDVKEKMKSALTAVLPCFPTALLDLSPRLTELGFPTATNRGKTLAPLPTAIASKSTREVVGMKKRLGSDGWVWVAGWFESPCGLRYRVIKRELKPAPAAKKAAKHFCPNCKCASCKAKPAAKAAAGQAVAAE